MSTTQPGAKTASATQANTGELSRSLSHGQMTMISMGLAVGTGLFLGSGAAIKIAGPATIISYAIGAFIAAIIAACAGEMAVRHPVPGGFGTIATRYLSPYAGYIGRWAYWAATVPLAGAELVASGHYISYWFPDIPLWASVTFFGVMILGLNIVSVKSFGATEFLLSSIKVIAVILFIVIGLALVIFGLPGTAATGAHNLFDDGGFLPNGPASIWISLAVVMFSFGGIEMVSISAAEAKNPARSVRTSVKAMVWRLSSFYVLSILVILCLIPWKAAAQLTGEDLTASPFVLVFAQMGIPAVADITNFVVLIAALSGANASLYAATRLLHALAGDRMAPKVAARTSKTGIPVVALLVSSLGVVVAVFMALAEVGNIFTILMALVTLCIIVVWAMILLTYIFFKKAQPNTAGFQVLGGRITAGIGLAGVLATLVAMFFVDSSMTRSALVGLGFFAFISIIFVVLYKTGGPFTATDLEEAEALD